MIKKEKGKNKKSEIQTDSNHVIDGVVELIDTKMIPFDEGSARIPFYLFAKLFFPT